MEWTKKEVRHFIVAVFLLTFIFGLNDRAEVFNASQYITNLFQVFLGAIVILFVFVVAQKIWAFKYGASVEFNVWWIKRYYFYPGSSLPKKIKFFGKDVVWNHFYIGPIVSVLVTLVSQGTSYFCFVGSTIMTEHKKYHAGERYRHILTLETAQVAFAGVVAVLLVVLMAIAAGRDMFSSFILMGMYFIGFQMIPLPRLAGGRLFFDALPLYVFTAVLALSSLLIAWYVGVIAAIIVGIIVAIIAVSVYAFWKLR